jgi:excisionase family DNA binding protein
MGREAFFVSDPSKSSTTPIEPRRKVRLSMREGARHAGCSERHLYALTYKGEIPTYMAAGHRWVDEEDIDQYFERQKAAGPGFRATGKRRPGRPKKQPEATGA